MSVSDGARLLRSRPSTELRYADFLRVSLAITGGLEAGRDSVHDAFRLR
jgi:hypothetical protein